MKSNEKKKEQLSISFGTASHRLKKSIMFDMAKKLNLDMCYRCNKRIRNVDEFSVDHKENWYNSESPVELFFSLDNIAFSHLTCNVDASEQLKRIKNNKHGFRGVVFDKRRIESPYQAKVWNGTKYIKSKNFKTAIEAGMEYDRIAIELFGNNALTNKKIGNLPQ